MNKELYLKQCTLTSYRIIPLKAIELIENSGEASQVKNFLCRLILFIVFECKWYNNEYTYEWINREYVSENLKVSINVAQKGLTKLEQLDVIEYVKKQGKKGKEKHRRISPSMFRFKTNSDDIIDGYGMLRP